MEELAYSLHIGNDKNKRNNARKSAKNNKSGSTSLSNNAIQNARQLSRVDKHNYRKYDNNQKLIEIIRGTSSLYEDVKKLYKSEFEESRIEYNNKQTRENRKINDYFEKISNNDKNDLACEIIIELGNKKYWDTKDDKFKRRMTSVYTKQVEDLETLVPNFKIASAIIHYDETSPHLHIVGVPIKYKNKNGMSKQVGKSSVFTKEMLSTLQDKMRILCIESFNKEYNLKNKVKRKSKGRNQDYHVSEMENYQLMKEELEKNKNKIIKANEKSLELTEKTKEIKDLIVDLKSNMVRKDNYTLKQEDKDKILLFIDKVDNTNNEYNNLQTLAVTLNNVHEELEEKNNQIKVLTENNNALDLRVKSLNKNIKNKENEIKDLEEENFSLRKHLKHFQNLFDRLINFIKHKLFNQKDRDKYYDVSLDLYNNDIISEDTMQELQDDYDYSIKDDYQKDHYDDFGL